MKRFFAWALALNFALNAAFGAAHVHAIDDDVLESLLDADEEQTQVLSDLDAALTDALAELTPELLNEVLMTLESELEVLEGASEEAFDAALDEGDVDDVLAMYEVLRRSMRDMDADQRTRLKNLRSRVRNLIRAHRSLRKYVSKAHRRVRREVRSFHREAKMIRRNLRGATDEEQAQIRDEVEDMTEEFREKLRERRNKDNATKMKRMRKWCLEHAEECEERLEMRRENRVMKQTERRQQAFDRCESTDNPPACQQRLMDAWEIRDVEALERQDMIDNLLEACQDGDDPEACVEEARETREEIRERSRTRR